MLRHRLKQLLLNFPEVRRVFDQRDTAVLALTEARAENERLARAVADAENHERLNAQLAQSAEQARSDIDELSATVASLKDKQLPEFSKAVYSHWGEDSIIEYTLGAISNGRYLDIGCYHPALYSNTMKLYDKGWSGVNIDPNPYMIEQYATFRPRDISLNVAVGAARGTVEFFKFHDWASSNTGSRQFAEAIAEGSGISMPEATIVEVMPLLEIMETYFGGKAPDFMNIDVEEMDIDVLRSNDWGRYRPSLVAVEDLHFSFDSPEASGIYQFMIATGYEMFSRCIYTSFFRDTRQ